MKKILFLFLIMFFAVSPVLAYTSWPASGSGVEISAGVLAFNSGFEPSGAVWHPGRGTFLVVGDDGDLAEITSTGSVVNYWWVGGDLEDITFIDSTGSIVYLADESTSSAKGFDLNTGSLNGEQYSFANYISQIGGLGLEGLAFIPDGNHPFGTTAMGGVFAAGWQYDGDIFFYEPASGNSSTYLYELHTTSGYNDLSGLNYDWNTGNLYAMYDNLNLLEKYDLNTYSLVGSYNLFGYAEEGIAFNSNCSSGLADVLVADDAGHIYLYNSFPITCPVAEVPVVEVEISGDRLDNDGDGAIDEFNTLSENGEHPYYSTLDPTDTTIYGSEILTVSGLRSGEISVRYGDNSVYNYQIFSTISTVRPMVSALRGSGYLGVMRGKEAALINGLTGEVTASTILTKANLKFFLAWLAGFGY